MMRSRSAAVALILAFLTTLPLQAEEKKVYFSVTTSKTFRPGEKPAIQVYAHNVDVLEFRVYRVKDPVKFFEKLQDVHQFGPQYSPPEKVDERTWLEKFHDWKAELWSDIRDFFRHQFSREARAEIRERHSERAKRSRISGTAGFADVPLLNSQQLVARWRLELPPKYVSESSNFPIDSLPSGTYLVEATDGTYRAYTVLLVSNMAMVVKASEGQLVVFTAQRDGGDPVADAAVTVWREKQQVAQFKSGADGIGEAKILSTAAQRESASDYGSEWVLAQHGDDVALVAPYRLNVSSDPNEDWIGYVYTDRPVYRPGDSVQFKAIVRHKNAERLSLPSEREVKVTINDSAQNTVLQKTFAVSPFGSVNGTLELPKSAALGYYSISLSTGNIGGSFQVEEYKKPEYFVKVTPAAPRVLQGSAMKATVEARYYFGEPVANAKVKYVVHTQRSYYFGGEDEDIESESGTEGGGDEGSPNADSGYFFGEQVLEQEGKLDANGRLVINIPTRVEDKYKNDVDYRIEARVTDAANREIPGHNGFLATYGSFHVAVQAQSYVYQQGETGQFTVTALDYDKKPVSTSVHIEFKNLRRGGGQEIQQQLDVATGQDGLGHFSIPLKVASQYIVLAKAKSGEREVQGSTWVWVAGKGEQTWAEGEARTLQLVADKPSYKVGDVAHILIMGLPSNSPFLLTTEGGSVLTHRLVHTGDNSITVDVPITIESQPNIYVAVSAFRDNQLYQGSKNVSVPPAERRLNIEITPAKPQFQPGEAAAYNIVAKDWQGNPVRAELSVGVVDDAVYAVEPDTSGDIVKAFYSQRYGAVQTDSSLEFYFHGEAGKRTIELAKLKSTPPRHRDLAQVKATDFAQPKVRKAFPDTAYWNATVETDSSGRATARLSFPDSLTTWRTTVRAVTQDTKGGWSVNRVLVRKNLMVRLAVPRFFRAGDEVTVSAIVHNYLESTKTARVSLEATGLDIVSGSTQDVSVPVRGEAKVDWRVRTSSNANAGRLLAKALTNEESDAMELTLPVIPFGVKQLINHSDTISETSGGRTTTIAFPQSSSAASRTIDLEISPSIVGSIFGSLEYLTSFPYGCTEQTMSSFLPNVVVSKALKDLNIKSSIEPTRLKAQVQSGLQRLYDYQHDDGGWGWWKDDDSMVFMTAYVVSGLSQARNAGYGIDTDRLDRGERFLREALRKHPNMIANLRAYVVYALAQAGSRDKKDLDSVWERKGKLGAEGVAFAGLTMQLENDSRADEASQSLRASMKTEGDAVYWPAASDDLLEIEVDDSAEATAYALKFFTNSSPNDPLLPQAVLWLMRHRSEGYYWYSTKQTAMVIYGVSDYLKASKELEPNFSADVLVNGKPVLTKKFTAQDAIAAQPIRLQLTPAQLSGNNNIEVRKNGAGRLYWSASGAYFSTDKKLYSNASLSLNIARDYYKLTSKNDGEKITYDLSLLSGPVASGDVLAVRISVSGNKWKYLLMEDPIPAGTEFIEHDEFYQINDKPSWWRNWYSRREFHDDRAAIFQTYFDSRREYFYLLKVVNPGLFQVSPASVQPMYQPDVLSTTDPSHLEVK